MGQVTYFPCCTTCKHMGPNTKLFDHELEKYVDFFSCYIDHPFAINGCVTFAACEKYESWEDDRK